MIRYASIKLFHGALVALLAELIIIPAASAEQQPGPGDWQTRLAVIRAAIDRGGVEQARAVADLVGMDWGDPSLPDSCLVREMAGTFSFAAGRTRGDLRLSVVRRFCTQCERFSGAERAVIVRDVRETLSKILVKEGPGAESEPVLIMLECLIKSDDPDGLRRAREFAASPMNRDLVFSMYSRLSRPDTIADLADFAGQQAGRNQETRIAALAALGRFGSGPPHYRIRVPALVAALDTAGTRDTALAALRAVCFPRFAHANEWRIWWKSRSGGSDHEIVLKDFIAAVGTSGTPDSKARDAVCEWIRSKGTPEFSWAAPAVVPLLELDDEVLLETAVFVLSGMGSFETLDPLLSMLSKSDDCDRERIPFVCALIRGSARIAAPGTDAVLAKAAAAFDRCLSSLREEIQAAAAEALGAVGGRGSAGKLVLIMKNPAAPTAAARAAESLGRMKATESLDEMLAVLPACVRHERLWVVGLGVIRGLRSMDLRTAEATAALVDAITSPQEEICTEAVRLVGMDWKAPEALEAIRAVAEDAARSRGCRVNAIVAIAEYSEYLSAPVMIDALRRPEKSLIEKAQSDAASKAEAETRKQFFEIASSYFSRTGRVDLGFRHLLLEAIRDQDANSGGRATAAALVGAEGVWETLECLETLVSAARDVDRRVFEAAFKVLKLHPSAEAFEALLDLLQKGRGSAEDGPESRLTADVLDSYLDCWSRIDRVRGNYPRMGTDKKAWEAWWRKHRGEFSFPK